MLRLQHVGYRPPPQTQFVPYRSPIRQQLVKFIGFGLGRLLNYDMCRNICQ